MSILGILVTHGKSVISYTELVTKRKAIIKSGMDANNKVAEVRKELGII